MSLEFILDLPEFKALVEKLKRGEDCLNLSGLIPEARAYFYASLAGQIDRPVVIVEPQAWSLDEIEQEIKNLLGFFSIRREVQSLPALSSDPYLEVPVPLETVASRLKVLYNLSQGRQPIILTNLPGLLKRVPRPEDLVRSVVKLNRGQAYGRDLLLQQLAEYGYTQEDLVSSAGEYAFRGGIVDIYSVWSKNPFRLEFIENQVASIREFDPSTQRSVSRLEWILIPSLKEYPGGQEFREEFKRQARKRKAGLADLEKKIKLWEEGEVLPPFDYYALAAGGHFQPFSSYLSNPLFILEEKDLIDREWEEQFEGWEKNYDSLIQQKSFTLPPGEIFSLDFLEDIRNKSVYLQEFSEETERPAIQLGFQPVPRFDNRIPFFLQYLKKRQEERDLCYILLSNPGKKDRLAHLLQENDLTVKTVSDVKEEPRGEEINLVEGQLQKGFSYPRQKIYIFAEKDVFTEERVLVSRPARKLFFSQFQDLKQGDYVVHTEYGVGLFNGLKKIDLDGQPHDFIELIYRDDDRLLVPVEDLNFVQKFASSAGVSPQLDKLGGQTWIKTRARVKKAAEEIAQELLELYARRKTAQGFAFSPAGQWEGEFDQIFAYEETDDQTRVIQEVRRDMESPQPMDRLLCGDVGYGKTEVAMRAAFKAAMDGKQVAVLCPTTVLANQHLTTFRQRMVLFPVRIEGLTRLQTKKEQQKILTDLKKGFVDIVIGTHRLLSPDVEFKDLGLLIIDEEQRFGVSHKEKIKKLKTNVDVLTLTATPIPRTLNLALSGLRDISLIETPPRDRLAVHTVVAPFNSRLVASAVKQELERLGQVYYIHNRIEDIDRIARLVEKLVPEAKVITI
ncbi:MAG: DEAD/DEAH box helicase, partial [Candidatus Aminicenantales bacterium]